jgi:hypothetical protein
MTLRTISPSTVMSSARRILAATGLCAVALTMPASSANAYVYTSCARFGSWTSGIYTVYNNVWGNHKPNTQCLNVNSASSWNVTSTQTGSGVKSYPNTSFLMNNKPISSINTLSATFSTTAPSNASYNAAFDIWTAGNVDEIMVWENWAGAVGPISTSYSCGGACPIFSNVSIGGATWNVYQGSNGANNVVSFLRTTQTSSATQDVKAILAFAASNGLLLNQTISQVQFGFEITATSGNQTFSMNNYTVTNS